MNYTVKVNEVKARDEKKSNIKGYATVVFGDSFRIGNIAILERKDNGQLFVAMPGYRTREVDENGNRIIRDVCNPITAEFREELYGNILKAYEGIHGENKGEITVGDPAVIPAFTVSVTPYDKSEGSLRGFARVCFDECFVVSNITLVQGKEDIFVSMPNYRTEQHDENGKPVYRDICYPITKEFREKLYGAVYNGFIEALEAKKEQAEPAEKAKKDKPEKAEKEETEKTPTRKSKSK